MLCQLDHLSAFEYCSALHTLISVLWELLSYTNQVEGCQPQRQVGAIFAFFFIYSYHKPISTFFWRIVAVTSKLIFTNYLRNTIVRSNHVNVDEGKTDFAATQIWENVIPKYTYLYLFK